nr:10142_t:CDS:2 [Entrophospora candida]CAG8458675.1 7423_t:CDS:2 [Entrophospora candida]
MLSTNPQDDKNNHKVKLDNKNDEQRILFVYIYDFLKKNGATETAKVYLSEVDITKHYKPVDGANGSSAADNDSNSLPDVELPVNAPEGFLYEWWNVFWDIYSAKVKQNGGTGEARSYIEQQMSVDTPNVNVDINNLSPQQRMKMNAANQTRRPFGTPTNTRPSIALHPMQQTQGQNSQQGQNQAQQVSNVVNQNQVQNTSGASQVHMTPGQISQLNPSTKRPVDTLVVNPTLNQPTSPKRIKTMPPDANTPYNINNGRSQQPNQQQQISLLTTVCI